MTEFKLSHYITAARSLDARLPNSTNKIRVALIGSFTLNGLEETLRVKCAENRIACQTYVAGYNQYNQEILNPESELYKFSPDVSFLILDIRSVLGNLFYSPYSVSASARREFVQKRAKEVTDIAKAFVEKSKSKLVITNFVIPTYSPFGIFETKAEYGLQDMARDLNSLIVEESKKTPSLYVYDFNGFVTRYGENNIFDFRQFHFGDIKVALDYIPYLAEDLMGYIKPATGRNRKCIVLDLDNTLWGGIVGEDGFDGIKLGPKSPGNAYLEFQRHLLSLYHRGIILAINSKNNPDDAFKVIREHPYMVLREENFACLKINWNDKISNMREIGAELNIGLDSMVFFDDDPVSRELMNKMLPEVMTVELPKDPSLYTPTIMRMNDFNVLNITGEDMKRGQMYIQQRKTAELQSRALNLEEFLSQLGTRIKIKKVDSFTLPRVSQLILKTNQFNLTTHRYQEEDIRRLSRDDGVLIGCAQVEDKFGDNGITGAFIVLKEPAVWTVDTFLLSCRVMGRGVEDAMMSYILSEAKKAGIKTVKAQYLPTSKNKPCESFLEKYGFVRNGDYWIFAPTGTIKHPKYLELIAE
jgi:FkbH-like protein